MVSVAAEQVAFGPFRLDIANAQLLRDGDELELRPQAFQVLKILTLNSGRYIGYDQMIREAWHGMLVSKHTVAVTVGEARKVLKEYGSWIGYRPKLGYRLEVPKSEELVRKGWHFYNRRTREGLEKALACFEQAALDDRTDFRAFEGIAESFLTLGTYGMRPPREMYPAFLDAHRHAVVLSGLTPELRCDWAHGLHMFERKFAEAEAEFLQARRENHNLAKVYARLSLLYTTLGRLDDGLEVLMQARAVDALWPPLPATEIAIRFCRREFDRAVACGKEALDLHPYLQLGRAHYAQALEYAGQMEEALTQYRLACVLFPDVSWLRALEAGCLARRGRTTEAAEILEELERIRAAEYVDAYYMGLLLDALERRDEAFQELERACEENSIGILLLNVDPKADSLRTDPRFSQVRNKLLGGA